MTVKQVRREITQGGKTPRAKKEKARATQHTGF